MYVIKYIFNKQQTVQDGIMVVQYRLALYSKLIGLLNTMQACRAVSASNNACLTA